jgi:hypothetical protein
VSKSEFDKICVFCDQYYVRSDKCVFIVVKIKCVNSSNISDICDKLNFTINYTYFTTTNTHFIKKHTKITIFDTFNGMVPPRDLSISVLTVGSQNILFFFFFFFFFSAKQVRTYSIQSTQRFFMISTLHNAFTEQLN